MLGLVQEEVEKLGAKLHFVSAREMVNVIKAFEEGDEKAEESRNGRLFNELSNQVRQAS